MGPELRQRVRAAVADSVAATGADLEDVEVHGGRSRVVRLVVDTDDGVTLDAAADINKAAGEALETSGVMGSAPYVLEVTSPGVSRPLTLPRHWRRNQGRLVRVRRADGDTVTGRVVGVTEHDAALDVASQEVRIAFADVERAVVQVEFDSGGRG